MKNETLLNDFREHLLAAGKLKATVEGYARTVRRFLKHVGDQPLNRISEQATRSFFDGLKGPARTMYAMQISQFLNFSQSRLPAVVNARGVESPRAAAPNKKELALRHKWTVEKLLDQKETDDDLIAKLAGRLAEHYLYFQTRQRGQPENLDDLDRLADECRDLIERHLPLFMSLSAGGRNVHPKIDERVNR